VPETCPHCGTALSGSYGGARVCEQCGYTWHDGGGMGLGLVLAVIAVLVWSKMFGVW
jgi:hypothetical protein